MQRDISRRSFLASSFSFTLFLRADPLTLVQRLKTPNNGLQPQAAVDSKGFIHLVYLYGDPAASDVGYVRLNPVTCQFSVPIRVNNVSGSAIALGTVRGAHIAIGKSDQVHVAWNGSSKTEPKGLNNSAPMLYTRMNAFGNGFEPQRNLMQISSGLDGGGALAADSFGNVYVVWHARGQEDGHSLEGEQHRRVWLAQSSDQGRTFAPERAVSPPELGACGCCGMGALCDSDGNLYLLYRTAREIVHRDMYLLVSNDRGKMFQSLDVSDWNIGACPMSTVSLVSAKDRVLLSWERQGQVYFTAAESKKLSALPAFPAPGEGKNRKHPSVAVNQRGQILLAWTEETGWNKGGALVWQIFDSKGRAISQQQHSPGVPAWGSLAVAASREEFVLVC